MSYPAVVYRIFIASPSDLMAEREELRRIVFDWNLVNGASRSIFLEPIGWETHSVPALGDRPQAILNEQILRTADLLIGVFWTRIGTATGVHPSGTVEEIEEHIRAGKPAMIYFSDTPVRPDSVDDVQFQALRAFRRDLQQRGIVDSYSGIAEFTEKVTRHLNRTLNDVARFSGPSPQRQPSPASPIATATLTTNSVRAVGNDAMELLRVAARADGHIISSGFIGGHRIQAAGEVFDTSTPRLTAKWKSALEELSRAGFVRNTGGGNVFEVTTSGYEMVDGLTT